VTATGKEPTIETPNSSLAMAQGNINNNLSMKRIIIFKVQISLNMSLEQCKD
jgi:hypothetical protein